jgi:hypothetical protein
MLLSFVTRSRIVKRLLVDLRVRGSLRGQVYERDTSTEPTLTFASMLCSEAHTRNRADTI